MRHLVARLGVVAAVVCAVAAIAAPSASAHTLSGPRPSNYRSEVVSVAPPLSGVVVRTVAGGTKVEVANRSGTEVTVLGYEAEPYLRVGPDGVFENLHSAATYLNRSLRNTTIPAGVDVSASAAPEWRKISDGQVARFHDHRAHWMGDKPPPAVAQAPGDFHHISNGTITLVQGPTRTFATVSLDWVPAPNPLPWFVVAGVALFVAIVAVLRLRLRLVAAVVGLLVLVEAAHTIAYEMGQASTGDNAVLHFVAGNFVSIIVWIVAALTIVGLMRNRPVALYGVAFVGILVALLGGLVGLSSWWNSQLPTAGPATLARLEVALALGLGAGATIGALIRAFRTDRTPGATSPPLPDQWLATLVVGLDDREIRRIAADLDADEILEPALADLALRLAPVADAFGAGALVLDVITDDDTGRHIWSLVLRDGRIVPQRGAVEPAAAQLRVPFARLLQLLAGADGVDEAIDAGRAAATGDVSLLHRVDPHFGERVGGERVGGERVGGGRVRDGRARNDAPAPAS